nr:hypothetical protein CFP56_00748 [Quercus suber]
MKFSLRSPSSIREHMRKYTQLSQGSDTDGGDTFMSQSAEKATSRHTSAWQRFRAVLVQRPLLSFALGAALLVFFSVATFADPSQITSSSREIVQDAQFLYTLIPIPKRTTDLCKTVLSAELLNYPNPWVVDWSSQVEPPATEKERELAKLTTISTFLKDLPRASQNATIIVLDGPGAWFQLRPEVLLKRFYEINRRADAALSKRMGKTVMAEEKLQQKVLFAAQQKCVKGLPKGDVSCYAPASSPVEDGPRYINMGSAIGRVKDMKLVYERAVLAATQGEEVNIAKIFATMYGQQEFQREVIRQRHWSWWRRTWHKLVGNFGADRTLLDHDSSYQTMDYFQGKPCEFGMGLDYGSEITFSTADGTETMQWEQHVSSHVVVASDIKDSMPPFWTVGDLELPFTATWGDVELLTNTKTNTVPALIHHHDPSTKLNEKWWKNIWFQHHARQLFSRTIFLPASVVANFVDQTAGVERSFWHPKTSMLRAGARNREGKFMHWADMCGSDDQAEEIFRDGKGPWREPAH